MRGEGAKGASALRKEEKAALIGICTKDFSKLYEMVRILSDREVGHALLGPGEATEIELDCLIMDRDGAPPVFKYGIPPIVTLMKDTSDTVERALAAAFGALGPNLLTVGIDPGSRPGMAFLADGRLISIFRAKGPEDAIRTVLKRRRAYRAKDMLVRVGNGGPVCRDAILGKLSKKRVRVEIVDEHSTTLTCKFRDENAAIVIAQTEGSPL